MIHTLWILSGLIFGTQATWAQSALPGRIEVVEACKKIEKIQKHIVGRVTEKLVRPSGRCTKDIPACRLFGYYISYTGKIMNRRHFLEEGSRNCNPADHGLTWNYIGSEAKTMLASIPDLQSEKLVNDSDESLLNVIKELSQIPSDGFLGYGIGAEFVGAPQ